MGQITATAKALIFNDKNELLILKRSEWKEQPKFSRQPDIPGGEIDEEDDNGRITAAREIFEETGIRARSHDLKLVFSKTQFIKYNGQEESQTKLYYMLKLDHTPEVKISWEHESFAWRTLDYAAKNIDLSYGIGRSDGLVIPYIYEHRDIFGV
ncbi:NUDIX hydrolase [Candidatus Saccharibacteria bacterium]|nr:NUDIX hydrolase [Candidatus Saccharibacteria bacterium]